MKPIFWSDHKEDEWQNKHLAFLIKPILDRANDSKIGDIGLNIATALASAGVTIEYTDFGFPINSFQMWQQIIYRGVQFFIFFPIIYFILYLVVRKVSKFIRKVFDFFFEQFTSAHEAADAYKRDYYTRLLVITDIVEWLNDNKMQQTPPQVGTAKQATPDQQAGMPNVQNSLNSSNYQQEQPQQGLGPTTPEAQPGTESGTNMPDPSFSEDPLYRLFFQQAFSMIQQLVLVMMDVCRLRGSKLKNHMYLFETNTYKDLDRIPFYQFESFYYLLKEYVTKLQTINKDTKAIACSQFVSLDNNLVELSTRISECKGRLENREDQNRKARRPFSRTKKQIFAAK